ncbi:MAG: hypothetical protein AB7V40_08165 [Methyloceanibacter sp.]
MRIENLRSWRTDSGGTQVEADVDGEPLWFASDDAALLASPEAFASALLIPAATRGEPLVVEACLDRSWLESVPAIQELAKEWWRLPGTEVLAADAIEAKRERPGVIAQCFTGGVDSFHALIHAKTPPAVLVYAHGYEFRLRDRRRLDAFLPRFREIAAAYGARPVLITTNLRRHSASRRVSWEASHGGALAALGHLLSDEVERIVIPSSFPYHDPKPWGSHWDMDHLWSSRRLAVEHADATLRRDGKVRAIVGHRMVLRHLQVCAESNKRGRPGNCSECEKCVRTMIALAMCGRLADCDAFDRRRPLEKRVDDLPIIKTHLVSIYEELLSRIDDPRLSAAVRRLIAHSRGRPEWWYWRVRRWRQNADARLSNGQRRVRRRLQTIAKITPAPLRRFLKRAGLSNGLLRWLDPNMGTGSGPGT